MMQATLQRTLLAEPDRAQGALILCSSPVDTERVAATLLSRFGSAVEEAPDIDSALAALGRGAKAVVCAGAPGAEELPATESWPPTIVLGTTFVDTELSALYDKAGRGVIAAYSSTDQAELARELERGFRYLDGLTDPGKKRPRRRRGPRDVVSAIFQATGTAAARHQRAVIPAATPAAMEGITGPSRMRFPGASLPPMLAFLPAVAAVVAVWVSVAHHVSQPPRIGTTGHPAAFEWDHRIFWGKQQFAAWLKTRGVSYSAWATNHPSAASALEHPAPPP
jgi:hypothetical protein